MFVCVGEAYYPAFGLKRNAPMMEAILWIALTISDFLPALCNFQKLGDLRQQSPIWLMSLQDVWVELSWSSSLCSSICEQWHNGHGWLLTGASLCDSSIFRTGLFPGRQQSFHHNKQRSCQTCWKPELELVLSSFYHVLSIKAGHKDNSDSNGG